MTKQINNKHELFCQEYIVDYNATQAAIRAGYSKKTAGAIASNLLRKVNILARVKELQKEQTARLAVTQDWVVQQLVDVVKKSKDPEPVMKWDSEEKKMVESGVYEYDSRGATRALELLGKHLGMYVDRLEEKVDMKLEINIDYGEEEEKM